MRWNCPSIGDELYNYLLNHGPLPIPKVQRIFAQLVGAVTYVHMQSCVHRDLKLENILLDTHEDVKLVDFGFTREYEGRINHLQTFCGTICYSAPEMLKGERYAGEKVDVWSLGIILYALLCGELPFDDDDDNVTRTRILTEEPNYPEHLPAEAVQLIKSLLSKRPLPRPALPEILAHPFLAEHAPAQQAILAIQAPPPFSTASEKDCLHRMRSAGVDIDAVVDSVIAEKCDALAGWWTLLLEKEIRKMRRRERKRKEREHDRSMHRLSTASSRLERIAPVLQDVDEDGGLTKHFIKRGRSEHRSAPYYGDLGMPDLPQLPEGENQHQEAASPDEVPPPPVDKDSIRSVSTTRNHRPIPPPKEGVIRSARSRGSTLHLVTTTDSFGYHSNAHPQEQPGQQKVKKRPSQAIIAHWKNWTHWFIENTTRRRRGHERRTSRSVPDLHKKDGSAKSSHDASPRPQTSKYPTTGSPGVPATAALPRGVVANGHIAKPNGYGAGSNSGGSGYGAYSAPSQQPLRPQVGTSHSYKRQSLSPSPLTPRSNMRRSSAGLRGRKSTSSSVSSVRSMHHHHHTHSKASSTSSTGSVSGPKAPLARGQSPHHSVVKVLPATPTTTHFPSNIRLVRMSPVPTPQDTYNEEMPSRAMQPPGSPNPFSSGVQFAKRKKNLFKGPVINYSAGTHSGRNPGSASHSRSGSASGLGRRSGEITIQEEEEDVETDEIEEVEMFSPLISGPGEIIEEQILEDDESTPTARPDSPDAHSPTSETPKELHNEKLYSMTQPIST